MRSAASRAGAAPTAASSSQARRRGLSRQSRAPPIARSTPTPESGTCFSLPGTSTMVYCRSRPSTECDYSFETSGPWELDRTDDGSIHPYGHPVPTWQEALQRGVYGLRASAYCPACDGVVDVVLEEYKTGELPVSRALWGGAVRRGTAGRVCTAEVRGSTPLRSTTHSRGLLRQAAPPRPTRSR